MSRVRIETSTPPLQRRMQQQCPDSMTGLAAVTGESNCRSPARSRVGEEGKHVSILPQQVETKHDKRKVHDILKPTHGPPAGEAATFIWNWP